MKEKDMKMVGVSNHILNQSIFCFAFATEDKGDYYPKMLFAILGGNDISMEAIKASIEVGGIYDFGYGEKTPMMELIFHKEQSFQTEKGKYNKIALSIDSNRKGYAFIHKSISAEYVFCFDDNPSKQIAKALGGNKYGLFILPEWEEIVFRRLIESGLIEEIQFYVDKNLFPHLRLFNLKATEDEMDAFITHLLHNKEIKFPIEGNGTKVLEMEGLTEYLTHFNGILAEKFSAELSPKHNPADTAYDSKIDTYARQAFPVQAHVATAIKKHLKTEKNVLLVGEMSTGKSTQERLSCVYHVSTFFN